MTVELIKDEDRSFLDKVIEAGRELRPTFRTAWPYVLFGIIIGGLLLFADYRLIKLGRLTDSDLAARMLEHLGVGFLVSSIAVFGYEWSGHINKTLHVGDRLRNEVARLHLIREDLGRNAIERGFQEILSADNQSPQDAENVRSVILHFMAIVDSVRHLNEQNNTTYIKFISVMLDELIINNARTLVEIGHYEGNVERHFKLDSAACAAKLLTAQMDAMGVRSRDNEIVSKQHSDEYLVVSDLISWKDELLADFQEATKAAIGRGVKVKRVFNLLRDERALAWEDASQILKQHCKDAMNMPGYEVRYILDNRGLRKSSPENIDLMKQHFGLFVQEERQSVLRIEVKKPDLSDFSFWRTSKAHEREDLRKFQRIWETAEPLTNEAAVDALGARWRGIHHIPVQDGAEVLLDQYEAVKSGPYAALFGSLAKRRIEDLLSDLQNMTGGRPCYKVLQLDPVQHYIEIFVQLMRGIIREKSEFCVVTNELIWAKNSFGSPDRRYLNANVAAARERHVKIRRIFVMEEPEELSRNRDRAKATLDMLRQHEDAFKDLDVEMKVYRTPSKTDYGAHFAVNDESVSGSNNFAIWEVGANREICTLVEYKASEDKGYKINSIKFDSDPELINEKKLVFKHMKENSVELRDFINALKLFLERPGS
jgi:hypothetical protein